MALAPIFLPYRSEFGHIVSWHAPWVNAHERPKMVCHEPGLEALYPGAEEHFICQDRIDGQRREWTSSDSKYIEQFTDEVREKLHGRGDLSPTFMRPLRQNPENDYSIVLKQFVPEPIERHGIECDIAVGARWREYGSAKNWNQWPDLCGALHTDGVKMFLAGKEESTAKDLMTVDRAWNYERFTDATIEAILASKLVMATDSGVALLALLCGKPLMLITARERKTAKGYGQVKLWRYERVNHLKAPIMFCEGWEDMSKAYEMATKIINGEYTLACKEEVNETKTE